MSSPAFVVLHIYKGQTFQPRFEFEDADGSPIDLSGQSARMQVRKTIDSADVEFSFSTAASTITIDGLAGFVDLLMSAEDTASIEPTNFEVLQYVYDLELFAGTPEVVSRAMQGVVIVHPEVTR